MAVNFPLTGLLCVTALLTTGAAEGNDHGCPAGWSPFGTRCFKFFESKLGWAQAEQSCLSHAANLASIHSAEENAFVADLIKQATGGNLRTWIGGHNAVNDAVWMWSDGSVWDYSNWKQGEPNNEFGKEHFAEINHEVALCWNDSPLTRTLYYICAKDAQKSLSLTLGDFHCKCSPNTS